MATQRVNVRVASADRRIERARDLLLKAKSHCLVAKVLRPPVHLQASVTAS